MAKFKATIKIGNRIHKIRNIFFDKDGNIERIITLPDKNFGDFWELNGNQISEDDICLKKLGHQQK